MEISKLVAPTVEGSGVASLWDNLGGILNVAAMGYLDREFDLSGRATTRDIAVNEQLANAQTQFAISQQQSQTFITIAVIAVVGLIIWQVAD